MADSFFTNNPVSIWVGKIYNAITANRRRKRAVIVSNTEDKSLMPLDRDQLVAEARNLRRNSSIAASTIRKHLDYVSTFNFQCRSGNQDFDREVEALMRWWSRPLNCDVTGRFSLRQIVRMLEHLAVVDGDAFLLKLDDGRVQIIEGDRIRTPKDFGGYTNFKADDFIHGVMLNSDGGPLAYALCERTGGFNTNGYNMFRLQEVIQSQHVLMHAYRERTDQTRGISPLASALTTLVDLMEAQEYALMKMKISQLLALKVTQPPSDDSDESGDLSFDFGAGPQQINLTEGEAADFMETNTPSTEFQQFMQTGIMVAMKALDMPFSFFDESHTNYSGARQALLQYQQSAEIKRDNLRQLLNALTVWRLQLFIADGHLKLPAEIKTLDDINFEWVGAGVPWIDPLKEVTADALAVKAKLTSRQRLCKENGEDFFEIVDELAAENDYMTSKGISPEDVSVSLADALAATADNGGNDAKAA